MDEESLLAVGSVGDVAGSDGRTKGFIGRIYKRGELINVFSCCQGGQAGEGRRKSSPRDTAAAASNITSFRRVDFVVLLWPVFLCHVKAKRDPYTSSYFYDSGGEKVVGWEGQTKLRY